LKTLAQFLLLGDPSQRPVKSSKSNAAAVKASANHAKHRAFLTRQGETLEIAAPRTVETPKKVGPELKKRLTELAAEHGVDPAEMVSFDVDARARGAGRANRSPARVAVRRR
jgi:hypothetical protein